MGHGITTMRRDKRFRQMLVYVHAFRPSDELCQGKFAMQKQRVAILMSCVCRSIGRFVHTQHLIGLHIMKGLLDPAGPSDIYLLNY